MNESLDSMLNIEAINESEETVEAFEKMKEVYDRFDYIVFGLFIALTLALIITGWYVGGHPIYMFIYFIVVIISVIASTIFANIWEQVSQASVFGTTINTFPITNNLLLNLPIYIAVIGFIGFIVMFAKPYIERR